MHRILEGIRVIDWTLWYAGAEASAILADFGADVIKVEQKDAGDQMRGLQSAQGVPTELPQGRHALFEHHNRNKRGLALDLKRPGGREIILGLAKNADIFVTNYRQDTLIRLGLDYPSVFRENPRVIYGYVSMFGDKGPDSDLPGFDLTAVARSGLMMACGDAENEAPAQIVSGMADEIAGYSLAFGIMAALLARERHGFGQLVTSSGLGGMMKLQAMNLALYLLKDTEMPRENRWKTRCPTNNVFKCRDGRWFQVSLFRDIDWSPFCEALGLLNLERDPEFASAEKRASNSVALVKCLDQFFATKDRDEVMDVLRKASLPHGPVNTLADLARDPQVLENNYLVDFDHPILGRIKWVGFPWGFSKTPAAHTRCAPNLGEHTEEILIESLGYSWNDIERLRNAGVI